MLQTVSLVRPHFMDPISLVGLGRNFFSGTELSMVSLEFPDHIIKHPNQDEL